MRSSPTAAIGPRLCPQVFTANVRHACRYGEVLAIGDAPGAMRGVAYWVRRPEAQLPPEEAEAFGFAALSRDWGSALEPLGRMEAKMTQPLAGLTQPWRYLGAIGVEPEQQGQGWGSRLLTRILADAAAAYQGVGLMTDRPVNVPFYRRAGFALVAQGVTTNGAVPWWAFHAPPVPPPG